MKAVHRESKKKPEEERHKIFIHSCLDEKELPVKVFEDRQSVLTELFKNKHIQSIYRVIAAVFVGICINTVAYDYLYNGDTRLGIRVILKGFRNFHLVFSWWLCLFLLSFCPYFGVKYWFVVRNKLKNSLTVYFWDTVGLIICALFLIGLIAGTSTVVVKIDVGFASGVAAVIETLRIVMKIYSFCRVNIPECLKCKLKKNYSIFPYPTFKHYLYFSFAPTFIYRHSYPREKEKRHKPRPNPNEFPQEAFLKEHPRRCNKISKPIYKKINIKNYDNIVGVIKDQNDKKHRMDKLKRPRLVSDGQNTLMEKTSKT
ncbi:hypothetical protein FQA39_LY09029 [Lamprigera yunnana]|nr:hypothetical protein FQA39_LY09029 [Lamprigera yunnana]